MTMGWLHIGWYHLVLAIMACLALAATTRTPRAWMWIAGLSASYVVSVLYTQVPKPAGVWMPPPAAIGFLCDAALAGFIHKNRQDPWEFWCVYAPVVAMSALCFFQTYALLSHQFPALPGFVFGGVLEIINAVCLALIGGKGLQELVGHGRRDLAGDHGLHPIAIDDAYRAKTKASKARWHWTPK